LLRVIIGAEKLRVINVLTKQIANVIINHSAVKMFVFSPLHGMPARLAIRKVSIRLSVKRVHCYKMEEKSVPIFTPYERSFSLVF